jgi:hypothetical protein
MFCPSGTSQGLFFFPCLRSSNNAAAISIHTVALRPPQAGLTGIMVHLITTPSIFRTVGKLLYARFRLASSALPVSTCTMQIIST